MTKIKNKFWILLISAILLSAVFFTVGKIAYADDAKECAHEYARETVEPTCKTEGYTEYTCTLCGESYKDNFIEKLKHTYSEVVVDPTCTHEGYNVHFCTACGYEYTDGYIAALGHNYADEVIMPTCTEKGYTTHTCEVCGYSFTDTYVSPLNHDYETDTIAPTCTEEGYTTYTCKACGYSCVADYVPAVGHDYIIKEIKPTCVSYGYAEHVCANCSDRYVTDYIKAFGHEFEEEIVKATEDNIGYTKHTCVNCDYSYLSDFVTSGDGGYTENPSEPETPEHIHSFALIWYIDNEKEVISFYQMCTGENCNQTIGIGERITARIINIETQEETQVNISENGELDISELYKGVYTLSLYKESGELWTSFDISIEKEHEHEYIFALTNDEENMVLNIAYECECGEKYQGSLTFEFVDESGERTTTAENEYGQFDYSGLYGKNQVTVTDEEGNLIADFELEGKEKEPTVPEEPEQPEEPIEPEQPGEDGNGVEKPNEENNNGLAATLLAILGILAAGGIALFIGIKIRKNKDKNK